MTEFKVGDIKELKELPNADEARKLLTKLVAVTAKVLIRRKWRVGILREFYPSNASLLGLNENAGQTIRIRLRSSSDKNTFLPWIDLLGTMVHELTHNEVGSHSAEFYSLMDKVHDEVDADDRGGTFGGPINNNTTTPYSFEGSKGVKLGGGGGWGGVLSAGARKNQAAEAALRRQLVNGGVTNGVVGGASVAPKTAEELRRLRLRSIERRQADQSSCSIGRPTAAPAAHVPVLSKTVASSSSSSRSASSGSGSRLIAESDDSLQSYFTFWQCSVCLEQNVSLDSSCVFCGKTRTDTDVLCLICSTGSLCGCCSGHSRTGISSGGGAMTSLGKRVAEASGSSGSSESSSSGFSKTARVVDLVGSPLSESKPSGNGDAGWQCRHCTFVNSDASIALSPAVLDGLKTSVRVCQVCQEIDEFVENIR